MPVNVLSTFPVTGSAATTGLVGGFCFFSGSVWIVFSDSMVGSEMIGMDPTTGAISVRFASTEALFGNVVADGKNSTLYATPGGGGSNLNLSRFSTTTGLIDTPAGGTDALAIIIENATVFAGAAGSAEIAVIPANAGTPTTLLPSVTNVGGPGRGQCAFDGTSIWFPASSQLVQVDPATQTILNTYDMSGQGLHHIAGICYASTTGHLYLPDLLAGKIFEVDLAGNVIRSAFAVFIGPIIFDGTYFWIISASTTNIGCLDPTTLLPLGSAAMAGTGIQIGLRATDGPAFVWATVFDAPGSLCYLQHFQFVPIIPPAGSGAAIGTLVGIGSGLTGQMIGGTK